MKRKKLNKEKRKAGSEQKREIEEEAMSRLNKQYEMERKKEGKRKKGNGIGRSDEKRGKDRR